MLTVYVQLRNDFGELKVIKHKVTKYPKVAKRILNKYPRGFITCANGTVIEQKGF